MLALHTGVAPGGSQFASLRCANWSILPGPLKIPGTLVPGSGEGSFPFPPGLRGLPPLRAQAPTPRIFGAAGLSAYCMDSKNSMPLLSAVRVTTAFFQLAV